MQLTRKHNWPELLNGYLNKASRRMFQYGVHDCCYFGSGAIRLLTVEELDIAASFGNYKTRIGALRTLKKFGCNSVEEFAVKITAQHEMPEVLTSQAQRGDVVLGVDEDLGRAVGICIGTHAAFADRGLRYVPMQNVLRAWHYG